MRLFIQLTIRLAAITQVSAEQHDQGKLGDMLLIDGDPTKNIRDIKQIKTVIKGGRIYHPVATEKALAIMPHQVARN